MQDSTELLVADSPRVMGRPRINAIEGDKLTARFPEGTLDRIRAVLREKEPQSDFIREAVEAELARREKK
jgi:hypothetical protein